MVERDTDFIHSEALLIPNDNYHWFGRSGPQRYSGTTTLAVTGNRYDGGFSSAGIFDFLVKTHVLVSDDGANDDPDASWNIRFERCAWFDMALITWEALRIGVSPPLRKCSRSLCVFFLSLIEAVAQTPSSGRQSIG